MQVVTRESFPNEICMQCITKLRISYQFYEMCKKSNITLQKYLNALICDKEKINPDNFVNTELDVLVTPLGGFVGLRVNPNLETDLSSNSVFYNKEKRKRITKEQRCSLLKRLLTPSEVEKDRDRHFDQQYYKVQSNDNFKGLKNIISFTQNYEFGRSLDTNSNYSATPLDKLKAFSSDFFKRDFSDFKNTILYIIENNQELCDSDDSEEDGFTTPDEKEDPDDYVFKFEEVIVEPDVKIKTEIEFEDEDSLSYCGYTDSLDSKTNTIKCESSESVEDFYFGDYRNQITDLNHDSMQLLNNFVGTYSHKRTFSPNNVRCRTRDNPYINPRLKEQFLHRSFKCEKCSRFFKSPGYLKAHFSKVHCSLANYR